MDEEAGTHVLNDGTVRIVIPVPPVTKKNHSQIVQNGENARPFLVPSRSYQAYVRECLWFLKPLGIEEPVNVEAHFYVARRSRIDLENLNAALHDVLTVGGVLRDDNAWIIVSTDGSRVHYDKTHPRTEVVITPTRATFPKAEKSKKEKAGR